MMDLLHGPSCMGAWGLHALCSHSSKPLCWAAKFNVASHIWQGECRHLGHSVPCETFEDLLALHSSNTCRSTLLSASMLCLHQCCDAAGVYSWSSKQPHDFQQLLPSSWHGGTCESLALAPDGTTLAVSFRRPLSNSGSSCSIVQPAHWLAKLAVAPTTEAAVVAGSGAGAAAAADGQAPTARCIADALAAGRQELLSSTLKLSGHDSKQLMTRGCFMPALPNLHSEQLLFASADEQRCEPVLWGCSSGARLVQCGSWPGLSSPVVQLSAGVAPMFNTLLLGALSERELKVFNYAYHA